MNRHAPSNYDPSLAEISKHVTGVHIHCLGCHRYAVLPLDRLFARLGSEFPYHDLAPRLRCTRCGARHAETQPDWPDIMGVIAHHGPLKPRRPR